MKKVTLFLLVVFACIACKEKIEEKTTPIVNKEKVVVENRFTVTYKCKFSANDNLQLFYTEDFKLHFLDELSVRQEVKASNEFVQVEFKLPEGVIPDRLRFDLGGNKDQKRIEIEEIVLKYKGESIIINKENFIELLEFNANVEYDSVNNIITTKTINLEGIEIYDPYLYCSNELVKALYNL